MTYDRGPAGALTSLAPGDRVCLRLRDLVALTRPPVAVLVVATTFTGYYAGDPHVRLGPLAHALLGTWLVASAAVVMNQVYEIDTDLAMQRTCDRPLPAGRIDIDTAAALGALLAACGVLVLGFGVGVLPAALALLTLVLYAAVYTPLKRRSAVALLIGAIPGALPPVIGYAAATGNIGVPALVLFGVMFPWQVPHFLALAWICRDDYARANLKVLTAADGDSRRTGRHVVGFTALLLVTSTLPFVLGEAGWVYMAAAGLLGGVLLALSVAFARRAGPARARRLFVASLVYLPIVFALRIMDGR